MPKVSFFFQFGSNKKYEIRQLDRTNYTDQHDYNDIADPVTIFYALKTLNIDNLGKTSTLFKF